jgi:exopolysaccharide biosynthesis protein
VARVDTRAPGISFLVTPGEATDGRDLPARKTSKFLEKFDVQFAVNANYFYPFRSESPWDYFPHAGDGVTLCGFAASRGDVYSDRQWNPGTLYLSAKNEASFDWPIGPVYNAISGNGFVARGGKVLPPPLMSGEEDQPYPRAGVGLTNDGRTLVFVMIDGKQPGYSEGATLGELGQVMSEHGCELAVRLDEGGSCAMAIEGDGGREELLNVPINKRIPYRERVVGNHLGVFARRVK